MINGWVSRQGVALLVLVSISSISARAELGMPEKSSVATKPAPPPSRFAVATVNVAELLSRAPQSGAASDKLQKKYSPIEAELDKEQLAIQALQEQLSLLPEDQKLQKERDLRSRQRNYSRNLEDFREELRLARDAELSKVQKQVFDAISAVRVTEKIDVVLKEGDYIAANPQVDITARVLESLQQQFNLTNPAPIMLPAPTSN